MEGRSLSCLSLWCVCDFSSAESIVVSSLFPSIKDFLWMRWVPTKRLFEWSKKKMRRAPGLCTWMASISYISRQKYRVFKLYKRRVFLSLGSLNAYRWMCRLFWRRIASVAFLSLCSYWRTCDWSVWIVISWKTFLPRFVWVSSWLEAKEWSWGERSERYWLYDCLVHFLS